MPSERTFLEQRLFQESSSRNETFQWNYLKNALLEWGIYVATVVYSGNIIALYAFI